MHVTVNCHAVHSCHTRIENSERSNGMDSWPIDYRTNVTPLRRGGRRRVRDNDPPCNYSNVKLGSVNAVTLFEKDHRLEWTSSVLKNTVLRYFMHSPQVVIGRRIVTTRQVPSPYHNYLSSNAPSASLCTTNDYIATRRARCKSSFVLIKSTLVENDLQANFLRTYLPDIDIPAELIRDEISGDAEIWKKFRTFDPYVGDLLEHVPCDSETAFLAFPMGELNRDLSKPTFYRTSLLLYTDYDQISRVFVTWSSTKLPLCPMPLLFDRSKRPFSR
jgi:hypothetical protein